MSGGSDVERGRRLASQRDDLVAQGVDPATLAVPYGPPVGPIDWEDVEHWGQPGHNVHTASWAPDGTHDDQTEEE